MTTEAIVTVTVVEWRGLFGHVWAEVWCDESRQRAEHFGDEVVLADIDLPYGFRLIDYGEARQVIVGDDGLIYDVVPSAGKAFLRSWARAPQST